MYTYFLFFKIKKIDLLSKSINIIVNRFVVTNGPGTIVPVAFSLFLNKVNYIITNTDKSLLINTSVKIIFIESFCRV